MPPNLKQMIPMMIGTLFAIAMGVMSTRAMAEVVVNGEVIGALDRVVLSSWNCGNTIPEGRYWLDFTSGTMGVENGPAAGVLPCYPITNQSADARSERAEASPRTDAAQSPYWEDRMCGMGACGVVVNPVYQ